MGDVRKLKDRAAELAARGKLEKAAEALREVVRLEPGDVPSRQRLAETLRRSGAIGEAIAVYRDVAERYARDGFLLKAIAIHKTVLELDPSSPETQAALAALHARKPAHPASASPSPSVSPSFSDATTPLALIVEAARTARASGVEEDLPLDLDIELVPVDDAPAPEAPGAARLPHVPIFSELSREAFVALAEAMVLRRVGRGDAVLREGEGGTSFYVVASGRLTVTKRDERGEAVPVATLGDGDFFGEMALLSGAPRAASVVAGEPSELLEFPAEALRAIAARHPHLAASLRRFCRRRLLANAMATSPLFRPFGREDRKAILARFRAREVVAGETIVREGEPADGMYVVLEGEVEVLTRRGGAPVRVGTLREGEPFGEIGLLRKAPATATVVVRRPGTLLRLPREEFDALVVTYPQILELVSQLTDERTDGLEAIRAGKAAWTDDGLVLV